MRRPPPVHPRVCGEQIFLAFRMSSSAGSSPRVRGTARGYLGVEYVARFIPACAGNSDVVPPASISMTVHPRVCGEQTRLSFGFLLCVGSSPRVRGTVCSYLWKVSGCRFIPACAGNSDFNVDGLCRIPVHPRVCGEQGHPLNLVRKVNGSSPRVRGTVSFPSCPRQLNRFIPACAGNRHTVRQNDSASSVHPRVCGEQGDDIRAAQVNAGSSPRVRGTEQQQ